MPDIGTTMAYCDCDRATCREAGTCLKVTRPETGMTQKPVTTAAEALEVAAQAMNPRLRSMISRGEAAAIIRAIPVAEPAVAADLRDKIARIITQDHLQLLNDFDADVDLYRLDAACADAAYATADQIISGLNQTSPAAEPAPDPRVTPRT